MKKRLLILGMITCLLGLTACGAKDATEETSFLSREEAMQYAESVVTDLNQIEEQGAVEDQISAAESQGLTYIVNAVQSWDSAQEELGDYIDITGSEVTAYEPDSITVVVTVKGSLHDAEVEVIMGQESYQSITTTIQRSFGELMKNAALNTLLGMGSVFVVLILIMFIIYLFGFIPRIQGKFDAKKKGKTQDATKDAIDNTVAQIATKEEEELTDDLELVAVIAAAVAASEGQTSTDGFVVRSIRRHY